MEIILVEPRGFCAGVERAIGILDRVLLKHSDESVYVHHEVVHNRTVVNAFKEKGVLFVDEMTQVPEGSVLVYSAHGVSSHVRAIADARRLRIYDATCPLVTKVHREVRSFHEQGMEVVLIGHQGHPEVIGTIGQIDAPVHLLQSVEDVALLNPRQPQRLGYVMQTTLSVEDAHHIVEALKKRFPKVVGPRSEDICYATQNRQDAVRQLAQASDLILVIGSSNSSNSNRLCEIARQCGVEAYLLDSPDMLRPHWFDGIARVGITAGASAPERVVQQVVESLAAYGTTGTRVLPVIREQVFFQPPSQLRDIPLTQPTL